MIGKLRNSRLIEVNVLTTTLRLRHRAVTSAIAQLSCYFYVSDTSISLALLHRCVDELTQQSCVPSLCSVQLQNLSFTQSYNNKKAQLTQR